MEVELEVIGRHAMFFDDDATAAFVNSKEALIEWNSLFIDRFDVRNLLSNPPSSFRNHGGFSPDSHLESQLDLERYADLPSSDELEVETEEARTEATGYHFVPFSYGNAADSSDQKNLVVAPETSAFCPPFPVPESLLQNLPPTEKEHQIIARTALFVGEHGGQSEIVLRVKQGDNPRFGFLMPDHHLHPYFRYLVDHLHLLKPSQDNKSQEVQSKEDQNVGALSLLGSVYGTGEDDDSAPVVERETKQVESNETSAEPVSVAGKDDIVPKVAHPSKVKVSSYSMNYISSIKPPNPNTLKKDPDILASNIPFKDKPKASSLFPVSEVETLALEPPSEMKRLIDRIVEIILKNGKDFEAVLIEQNDKHGKFPFLLPSNKYHSYYLKILKKAQETRLNVKNFSFDMDKNTAPRKDNDAFSSLGSSVNDLPLDYDKKEKFKMIINKSKKDPQDNSSKDTQQQTGITVDTAAAAAILQAATRGMKKPNLDIFSKSTVSGASHGSSNEGGQGSSLGSLQSSAEKEIENQKPSLTIPVAKEIAKSAARSAASEADSSEAGLTRDQKLKAERLRRAKMFAAMVKSGSLPLITEPQPSKSEIPESATDVVNGEVKDREGSSGPTVNGTSTRMEMPMRNSSDGEIERKERKTRHYRSHKHDENGNDEYGKRDEDEDDDENDDSRHSRKKRRSHHSSRRHRDRSKDVHKHRRKNSSSSKESRHKHKHVSSEDENRHHKRKHKHESSSEDENRHHKRKHKHESSSEDENRRHKRKHKHESSSEDENRHLKRKHKHEISSEDENRHRKRKHKHETSKRSRKSEKSKNEVDLEEGEIRPKSSGHSSSVIGDDNSTDASVDASKSSFQEKALSLPPPETTEVPDELRAKIRAMLLATM